MLSPQTLPFFLRLLLGPQGQQHRQGSGRHPTCQNASGKEKILADCPVGSAVPGVIAVFLHDLCPQICRLIRGIPAHDPGIAVLVLRVLPDKSPQLLLILRLHRFPRRVKKRANSQQYKKEQPCKQGYSLKLSSVHI